MKQITVPAVSAALLTIPRDCETCLSTRQYIAGFDTDFPGGIYSCPDCRPVCEWVACDDPLEVGSTVHIVAGPAPECVGKGLWFGEWHLYGDRTLRPHLWHVDGKRESVPLRPGVVVATGVVAECVPIVDGSKPTGPRWEPSPIPCVEVNDRGLTYWWHHDAGFRDMTAAKVDQDWSPTRPCPRNVDGHGRCVLCGGAGTLPRYAIRLTDVATRP